MKRSILRAAMIALLLAGGMTSGAAAAPSRVETDAPATITLPFAPPLGVPIRYDFEMRTENGGQTQLVRSVDELTYSKADNGGFRLSWVTKSVRVEAPGPMQAILSKVYAVGVGVPLVIAVTPQGYAEALLNEADVRTVTETMLAKLVTSMDSEFADLPADARAIMAKIMGAVVEQQRTQSQEAFINAALESPRMMLRNIGPMLPGQPTTEEVEAAAPIGDGRIHYLTQSELRRYVPGSSAEVVLSSTANQADLKRLTDSIVGSMLAAITDPKMRAATESEIAKAGSMTFSDEAVMTIALPSGVTDSIRYRKQVAIPGRPMRIDTRSYTRVQ
ncbi:MAG: hypothetical protein ACOYLK_15815 [Sphingomonas sp.]